jgi:hypothetical protein
LKKEDLNLDLFNGDELIKEKTNEFLGFDKNYSNKTPCIFEQGLSVSGQVSPSDNWMLVKVSKYADKVVEDDSNSPFYDLNDIKDEKFKELWKKFLDTVLPDDSNGGFKWNDGFSHKTTIEERGKKLHKFENLALNLFANYDVVMNTQIERFNNKLRDSFPQDKKIYVDNAPNFRFLIRMADYFLIFKGYDYVLSYALMVGGFHLMTFYICLKNHTAIVKPEGNKKRNKKAKSWVNLDALVGLHNKLNKPDFEADNKPKFSLLKFTGEIESIIRVGWNNAVSKVFSNIGHAAAMTGKSQVDVVVEMIRYVLLMENPINGQIHNGKGSIQCSLSEICEHNDNKFLVAEGTTPQQCKNATSKCIQISHDDLHITFRNISGEIDKASAQIALERLTKTFVEQYSDVILKSWKSTLKTAIISILIDSYAHNISAHSLSALEWWFMLRSKILDKRFYVDDNGFSPGQLHPADYKFTRSYLAETSERYYAALNLKDGTYNQQYASLFDMLQFLPNDYFDVNKSILAFNKKASSDTYGKNPFSPQFPVSLDYALHPLFRYLRDKGAFWSGVTRDMTFGGESKTWYKILWEDFLNNPLYLGTIAKSEGILKINVFLDINIGGNKCSGRFVSIDLSLIDIETQSAMQTNSNNTLAQQQNDLDNAWIDIDEDYVANLKNSISSENSKLSLDKEKPYPYVDSHKYSKYAFVKLGEKFAEIRKIINDENYKVFLPGGVVGEHALFTLFENTLRNVKHYKERFAEMGESGLNFVILISEDSIKGTSDKQLFKVGVWLDYETPLITKKADGTEEYVLFNLVNNTLSAIVTDTGAPKMGGNTQDKVCAAMLFNNHFHHVESIKTQLEREYYPWVTHSVNCNGDEISLELDRSKQRILLYKTENDAIAEINTKYATTVGGKIVKSFYLWKAEDVKSIESEEDITNLENENIARFRFLVNNSADGKINQEIQKRAAAAGIIRMVKLSDVTQKDNLPWVYLRWLNEWLGLDLVCESAIRFSIGTIGTDSSDYSKIGQFLIFSDKVLYAGNNCKLYEQNYFNNQQLIFLRSDENIIRVAIAHSTNTPQSEEICNVRSHGWFFSQLFAEAEGTEPKYLKKLPQSDSSSLVNGMYIHEFIEAILTKVVIFDKRVFNLFPKNSDGRIYKKFPEQLRLSVFDEKDNCFNDYIDAHDHSLQHFLVIHLSFIENLGFKEENINLFFKKYLFASVGDTPRIARRFKDNFRLVIITGRGRDLWWKSLCPVFKKFVIFRPVESILSAIGDGLAYKDDVDVKFKLIKVLFGN